MPQRPLLIFPHAVTTAPPPGIPRPRTAPHFPPRDRQRQRVERQLATLGQQFNDEQARLSGNALGLEPESVLVIETIGSIEDFRKAILHVGIEFLDEWDTEDIEPDDEFYQPDSQDQRTEKKLTGRVYLSMTNQQGLTSVLSLWNTWCEEGTFPRGQTKWRDVFKQLKNIRRWSIEDRLAETGLLEIWQENLQDDAITVFPCHLELWYRQNEQKRQQAENNIATLVTAAGGRLTAPPLHLPDIHLHALKVELPRTAVEALISDMTGNGIELFKNANVMFYRPTGQCLASLGGETEPSTIVHAAPLPSGAPIAAIIDGLPLTNHDFLRDRLLVDDPDDIASLYRQSERRHGTAMASLIIHGELDAQEEALSTPVYCRPVMQPDRGRREVEECIPEDIYYEDVIYRAVRRMFEGEGEVPAQAPSVRVINLSIGDCTRPFITVPSPWARLLDWLSWRYSVLFCVSSGNYGNDLELEHAEATFRALPDQDKAAHTLQRLTALQADRRLLSPAESINAITVGARHTDRSTPGHIGRLIDISPDHNLPGPYSRAGHGFRRSIKPDILMPGGRRLYHPPMTTPHAYRLNRATRFAPGQKVASDGPAGSLNHVIYTGGTSNAAALATRSATQIQAVLQELRDNDPDNALDPSYDAVLMKALLVHGATWNGAQEIILNALDGMTSTEMAKRRVARQLGYGFPDVQRVLECTEQRATVIGANAIQNNQIHEYRFPLPPGLSGSNQRRRLTVTLAWFSPINPAHRNLRRASLTFEPPDDTLPLGRQEADWQQVRKGTVQHEILVGEEVSAFEDGTDLVIPVRCKSDAGELTDRIPYGIAVTLEVAEGIDIPVYQQVRDRIALRIRPETE